MSPRPPPRAPSPSPRRPPACPPSPGRAPLAAAASALLLACAAPAPAAVRSGPWDGTHAAPECATAACLTVYFVEANRLEVRLTLPAPSPGSPAPFLSFDERILGASYADRHVREVTLAGDERPWTGVVSDRAPGGGLAKRWRVRLDWDPASEGFPPTEGALATGDKWHLPGLVFVPDLGGAGAGAGPPLPARLAFELPADQVVVTALPTAGRVVHAGSLRRLGDAAFQVGRFDAYTLEVDGLRVLLASGSWSGGELAGTARVLAGALRAAAGPLGPPATRTLAVTIERAGDRPLGQRFGFGPGAEIVVTTPRPLEGRATAPAGGVLVHEAVHLWWPGDLAVHDEWLKEGFAEWLAVLVGARADGVDGATTARVFARLHRVVESRAERRPLAEAGTLDFFAYEAGALAAFCADAYLAERGRALAPALAALAAAHPDHARGDGPVPPLPPETFFAALDGLAPGAAAHLRTLLDTPGGPPFADCLRRAGWSPRPEPYSGHHLGALLAALGLGRLVTTPKSIGLLVERAPAGSAFRENDLLLSLDGHTLLGPEDLTRALRAVPPARSVSIALLRAGAPETVTFAMPAVERRADHVWTELSPAAPR